MRVEEEPEDPDEVVAVAGPTGLPTVAPGSGREFEYRTELLTNADQACTLALSDTPYVARTWQSCAEVSRERGELDEAASRSERARQLGAAT